MKQILFLLSLFGASLAAPTEVETARAGDRNPLFIPYDAYSYTPLSPYSGDNRDQVDEIIEEYPLRSRPDFPFLRTGIYIPNSPYNADDTNDTLNSDETDSNEDYRPTWPEFLANGPLFPPRPVFPMQPIFPMLLPVDEINRRNSTDFFSGFFGDSATADRFPPNYANSTYEVKDINGTKILVNQTIDKKTQDGFKSYFNVKVVQIIPKNSSQEDESTLVVEEDDSEDVDEDDDGDNDEAFDQDEEDKDVINEVDSQDFLLRQQKNQTKSSDDHTVISSSHQPTNQTKISLRKVKRSINGSLLDESRSDMTLTRKLNLPTLDLNGKNSDYQNKSYSYVYKNMDGKEYSYGINHKDGFTSWAPPPPDLRSDTRVNLFAATIAKKSTNPLSEVYNHSLVLKELNSHVI